MELVPFYTMFAPVIGKELAELLDEGCSYSLPVSFQRAGRLFDAMFLYKPENGPDARPTGWILLDSYTGKLAVLADCDVMDFAAPDLVAPEISKQSHAKELTPKKAAQLRSKINDCYDEMRKFVFTEKLDRGQASIVSNYKELFLKISDPVYYPFYYALSPGFFHWLRMPLPIHKASLGPEDKPVLDDPTQLLILQNLQQLVFRFENKIQVDEHKQELFDEMHAELQEYKNGMIDQLTLSLERDIIKLIDDVSKSVAVFAEKDATPESYERLFAMFKGVETDLEDLLYRHGVEPYNEEGEDVNVARQKILSTTPTSDPGLDKKIAARLSRGWEKQDKIIRPERVSVYLYQEENDV